MRCSGDNELCYQSLIVVDSSGVLAVVSGYTRDTTNDILRSVSTVPDYMETVFMATNLESGLCGHGLALIGKEMFLMDLWPHVFKIHWPFLASLGHKFLFMGH